MKLSLLSEYINHIQRKDPDENEADRANGVSNQKDSFLIVVTQEGDEDDDMDHFEDNVSQIRNIVDVNASALQTSFKERSDYLSELIAE